MGTDCFKYASLINSGLKNSNITCHLIISIFFRLSFEQGYVLGGANFYGLVFLG